MNKRETIALFRLERFILELLKCNFTQKKIAEKLNISIHSAKSHITRLERLGLWKDKFFE